MINEKVSIKDFKDLEERVGKIGETIQGTEIATTIESNAHKSLRQIVLPKGVWLIDAYISYAPNANGYRFITLSTTKDLLDGRISLDTRSAVNGVATYTQLSSFVSYNTERTIYLNGYQNSTSELTVSSYLRAVRFA